MKKIIFKGAGVAVVTPMKNNGDINYNTLEKLIEFQIENSTDAIITCGTTGESATLSPKEHSQLIEFTLKKVSGRVPVIAGTGSNNTKTALELSKEAEEMGVDGLLIVTPYYNKTSQEGLIKHYTHIADNVNTPIILYNVPSRTGVNISPETYYKLSKHPNICATKEANGNLSSIAKTAVLCKDNLNIYSGNDDQIIPILSLGGIGVISVLSNICPKECHDMVTQFMDGNNETSKNLQLKYLELIEALFCEVNPMPVKSALNIIGLDCGNCRMPLTTLSQSSEKYLKDVLAKYNLIQK